ncbi:MAG: hypothetical protein ABR961_12585 [Thermoanaerobaculaceae bacterium]
MRTAVVSAVVALAVASVAVAKEYRSSFGFAVDVPENWLVLTKQAIAEDAALAAAPDPKVGNINPDILRDLRAKVENGSIEMFFDRTTSDATFADNINILVKPGQAAASPDRVREACDAYPGLLAKYAGRGLKVEGCESRNIGSLKAFYVEYEGVVAGTVTMQYQFSRPDNQRLLVTATCKRASLDKVRPEFEEIVRSIRLSRVS